MLNTLSAIVSNLFDLRRNLEEDGKFRHFNEVRVCGRFNSNAPL